jgi:hypothetical protein
MGKQIVAVGLRDVAVFGMDTFIVQLGPDEVMPYEVHKDGRVRAMAPEPQPLTHVASAVEKFSSAFFVDPPIAITEVAELVKYLGKFAPVSPTRCRYTG